MVPGEKNPLNNGPRKKWSPGKMVPKNWSPNYSSPEKCPLKLFCVKRMLGNLNDFFIYFDWFYYTQKKMFNVHLKILHAPKFEHWRSPGRFFVVIWVFIDWSHPNIPHTHTTMLDAHPTVLLFPSFGFVSEFWVCFRVLGFYRLITSQYYTPTPRCLTLTPWFFVSEFSGTIFPGTIFPGDHFSGMPLNHSSYIWLDFLTTSLTRYCMRTV